MAWPGRASRHAEKKSSPSSSRPIRLRRRSRCAFSFAAAMARLTVAACCMTTIRRPSSDIGRTAERARARRAERRPTRARLPHSLPTRLRA
eukprot:4100680-Prymnesium_polylepis.1